MAYLHRTDREFFFWPITEAPENAALEVSHDKITWHPTATFAKGGTISIQVLVAGPEAPAPNPAGTIALPAPGEYQFRARVVDQTEVVSRSAGTIVVT